MINIDEKELENLIAFIDYLIDVDVIDGMSPEEAYHKNKDVIINLFENYLVSQYNAISKNKKRGEWR